MDDRYQEKPSLLEWIGIGAGVSIELLGAVYAREYPIAGSIAALSGAIGALGMSLPHLYRNLPGSSYEPTSDRLEAFADREPAEHDRTMSRANLELHLRSPRAD